MNEPQDDFITVLASCESKLVIGAIYEGSLVCGDAWPKMKFEVLREVARTEFTKAVAAQEITAPHFYELYFKGICIDRT